MRAIVVALLAIAAGCGEDEVVQPDPQPPQAPASEIALVEELVRSYQNRNVDAFINLFPTSEEAEYLFLLNEPDPDDGSTSWGRTVELSVHQRMFDPEEIPVGEDQVPDWLWLTDVSINLTRVTDFEERTDLYEPLGELDPARWRVTNAEYHAVLFFGTQGETDYTVDGRTNFVIMNDLAKTPGEDRKYLIYRWEDLGDFNNVEITAVEPNSWGRVKGLYRSS